VQEACEDGGGEEGRVAKVQQLGVNPMRFLDDLDAAAQRVEDYYSPHGQFSGRKFEFLAGGGSRPEVADQFTAEDIVAVSMLSVSIPPEASIQILETRAATLNDLLRGIPREVALWEAGDDVLDTDDAAAGKLCAELKRIDGVGWVTANKLLARKRPELLPVYDQVVKAALRPPAGWFWISLRNALQADGCAMVQRLREIRKAAELDVEPPLLRVLDVAVWMTSRE
jgi:uncharacterized protein DUF6308